MFFLIVGIISGAMLNLREEFHLSCFQQELIVSFLVIGGLFSSLVGGAFSYKATIFLLLFVDSLYWNFDDSVKYLQITDSYLSHSGILLDYFGRKITIIANAYLFLIGALILSFSRSFEVFVSCFIRFYFR